jgi:hypothetical protein
VRDISRITIIDFFFILVVLDIAMFLTAYEVMIFKPPIGIKYGIISKMSLFCWAREVINHNTSYQN